MNNSQHTHTHTHTLKYCINYWGCNVYTTNVNIVHVSLCSKHNNSNRTLKGLPLFAQKRELITEGRSWKPSRVLTGFVNMNILIDFIAPSNQMFT